MSLVVVSFSCTSKSLVSHSSVSTKQQIQLKIKCVNATNINLDPIDANG